MTFAYIVYTHTRAVLTVVIRRSNQSWTTRLQEQVEYLTIMGHSCSKVCYSKYEDSTLWHFQGWLGLGQGQMKGQVETVIMYKHLFPWTCASCCHYLPLMLSAYLGQGYGGSPFNEEAWTTLSPDDKVPESCSPLGVLYQKHLWMATKRHPDHMPQL